MYHYLNLFEVSITFPTYVSNLNLKSAQLGSWYVTLVLQEVLQTDCVLQIYKRCAFSKCYGSQFDI
jgi:hypothetical protein